MPAKSDDRSITLRAFGIIEAVLAADRGLTVPDILNTAKLPKPSAYRILRLLEDAGLLVRDLDGRHYIAGPGLTRIAFATFAANAQRTPRMAILRGLADETSESCALAVLDGVDARYVERADSRWPLRPDLPSGTRVPLHATASGKLLLAHTLAAVRDALLERLRFDRFTPRTYVDRQTLDRHLTSIRKDGYALDTEEWLSGVNAIAVPVSTKNGRVIAALTIEAAAARCAPDALRAVLPNLRTAAERLGALIAFTPDQ